MKWLLINPTRHFLKMFPLGIAYVSSALKRAGADVRILDLNFVEQCHVERELMKAVIDHPTDVVGIGALYAEQHWIKHLIGIIRDANPKARIVVGNGVVSCDPKMMLPHLGGDIAVVGEGEQTVVELHEALVKGRDLAEVAGLAFGDGKGGVTVTPARKAIMDLQSIALPDYEGFDVKRYITAQEDLTFYGYSYMDHPRALPILASRSCPFSCTFCYHTISTYRKRSLDHFFDEVDMLVRKYDVNMLQIYDDLFAVNRERVVEFCDRIKSYGLIWQVSLRVQNIAEGKIDLPVLLRMKDAGCRVIGLGLESVSSDVLGSMKKKITRQQVDYALDLVTRSGINFQGNFIFGDSAETVETANESLDYWRRHRHYAIQTDPIWVFPGTAIYSEALLAGRIPAVEDYLAMAHPVPNVSRMDDETFALMCDTLGVCRLYLNGIPGQLIDVTTRRAGGRPLHTSTCRCPHCGENSTYADHDFWQRFICRHCGGMFDIPVARYIGRENKAPSTTATLQEAEAALRAGDPGRAYLLARGVAASDCNDADAAILLGTVLLQAGFAERAEVHFRKALSLDPQDGVACNNFGICLFAANRVALALLMFRQALLVEESQPEAEANEKMALRHLGGDDGILELVQHAGLPRLPVTQLQIAIPAIDHRGGNVPVRTPLREVNDQPVATMADHQLLAVG